MTKTASAFDDNWNRLTWTDWVLLDNQDSEFKRLTPKHPGLYRVRARNQDGNLVYIGQTGRNLKERLMDLARNVKKPINDPPWNDPHTAAPALWAYRIENHFEFLVSTSSVDLDYQVRQCFEDMLLYLHRLEFGHSTLCNHGRIHPFWTRASSRSRKMPTQRLEVPVDYPSLSPAQGNQDVLADDWLGLPWSEFKALDDFRLIPEPGVYRIFNGEDLVYLGESKSLSFRLATHAQNPQFAGCLASCVTMDDQFSHQRKERETDLVGAYYLSRSRPPLFQYLGDGKGMGKKRSD